MKFNRSISILTQDLDLYLNFFVGFSVSVWLVLSVLSLNPCINKPLHGY